MSSLLVAYKGHPADPAGSWGPHAMVGSSEDVLQASTGNPSFCGCIIVGSALCWACSLEKSPVISRC